MTNNPVSVRIRAHARLHMGFLDLNGGLGRRFGSVGLSLEHPVTSLHMERATSCAASGPSSERALTLLERLIRHLGLDGAGARVRLESAIDEHAGFGSGTQLSLAVGVGLGRLFGLPLRAPDVARLLDRGARSGVGLGSFERGGFIVDGGHRGTGNTPPVVSRLAFPSRWRLVLVLDRRRRGVHGDHERRAFGELPVFPADSAGHLCRLVLMQMLPALAETDVAPFGRAISEIQRCVGDHFAAAQGGRYASPEVAALLSWMENNGAAGVGQSSWGPTGFAICENRAVAASLCERARTLGLVGENLELQVSAARNRGAEIHADDKPAERVREPATGATPGA